MGSTSDQTACSLIHLKAFYTADEVRPGYMYSGSYVRSHSIVSELLKLISASEKNLLRIRMKRPVRSQRDAGTTGLLELRFSLRSMLQRILLGSAGSLGLKQPLFLMEYFGNGFDSAPLFGRLSGLAEVQMLVFDNLPSFGFLGWRPLPARFHIKKVYLSHDYESDFVRTRYLSGLIRKRIDFALEQTDLLLVASRRDKLRYLSHGKLNEDRMVVYPNIFPTHAAQKRDVRPEKSAEAFTIAIVQSGWLGKAGALEDAQVLAGAVRRLEGRLKIRVIAIGEALSLFLAGLLPERVELLSSKYLHDRQDFLALLSHAHVGINRARWLGGSNVKKYDYALSGTVILSNALGARGEMIPHELVFADADDLASKILGLVDLGNGRLTEMGVSNRESALLLARAASEELARKVRSLTER